MLTKELLLENTAPTGRYPKLWDLARVQAMRRRTGAMIVPLDMCEWGLDSPWEWGPAVAQKSIECRGAAVQLDWLGLDEHGERRALEISERPALLFFRVK